MGLCPSGDVFCHRTDQAIVDLEGVMKLVDDCLTGGRGVSELRKRLRAVLLRCREFNIKISKKKFHLGRVLAFGSFVIDGSSGELLIGPDPARVCLLYTSPSPRD